jgi:RHS repeat-associated protein
VHSDHLNTPRKLTDASGQAAWQWSYSAFGEDKPTLAKNRFANLETTPNPGTTGISEVKFNLRYPGQYADEESGLFYNYFRSYDARTGRYSQPDPIGLDGGWNRFGYVDGNSLEYSDPKGLWRVCFVFSGSCVETSPPLIHPDYPYEPTSTGIPVPEWWRYTIPGMVDNVCTTASDLIMEMAKGGRQNVRDSGLVGVSDEEVKRRLKDPGTSSEERKRLEKEEKGRGLRNKRKDGRN